MPEVYTAPVKRAEEPAAAALSLVSSWQRWLPLALFSVLWLDLFRQLSYTWETSEQYAYGWFVPIFAAALFWRRWRDRPELRPPPSVRRSLGEGGSASPSLPSLPSVKNEGVLELLLFGFVVLLCLLLLPLRVIHEINQDWPLITWPLATSIVVITLYALSMKGGWPWVRHFAFATCFILIAVKWPYRIERGMTMGLMSVVTSLTVELLGWFDIPAMQHGNLIELSTGTVGVDEACSGIRSFQSSLMAGLLMGELYRMRLGWRAVLVIAGLIIGFCLNVVRTLLLSWQASKESLSAIDKWHDPAGMTITVLCFFCLWALALVTREWVKSATDPSGSRVRPSSLASSCHPSCLRLRSQLSNLSSQRFLAFVGLWSLLCIGATETWYRAHDARRPETTRWWVSYPTNLPSFQSVTVSKAAAKLLRHDAESGGAWEEPDGTKWSVYCFRWKEGDPAARMSAQGHRPEYCLVGSGHKMLGMSGIQYMSANGINLPFRFYTFQSGDKPLHVFFSLWEDGAEKQAGFGKSKQGDRLRAVLDGRRGMGQQTLEIICSGYPEAETAKEAIRKRLAEITKVEKQPQALTQLLTL